MNEGIADFQLPIADLGRGDPEGNWQLEIGNWR
jgi:hypothetical protein